MSNPFYSNNFAGTPGQTARAEDIANEFTGVETGFNLINTQLGYTLRSSDSMDAIGNAASRANKWIKFDASGQPTLVNTPLNVTGAWQPSHTYASGDAYTADPNGTLYYVDTAYTSGATFGSTDTANTTVLSDLAGLLFVINQIKTASFTAAAAGSYLVDSTGGDIVITLPSGSLGDSPINITHVGGSLAAGQSITIQSAAGQFIMGSTENTLSVNTANISMTLMYGGATYGWRLRTM